MGRAIPAIAEVNTYTNCGACGWDISGLTPNLNADSFCDACGADLTSYWTAAVAPVDLGAVAGSLLVTFSWTATTGADTTDFRSRINGGSWTVVSPDTTPTAIVAAEGDVVEGQVRSVIDTVIGDWSASASATALA